MSAVVAALAATVAVLGAAAAIASGGSTLAGVRTRRRARAVRAPGASPTSTGTGRALLLAGAVVGARSRLGPSLALVTGRVERAGRKADRELPAMLDQVTRQLRTGASLPVAIESAARGRGAVGTAQLADDLAAGTPLVLAVHGWSSACPTPARSLAAAALTLASEAGGAVAVVLDGVTDTLRDRVALDREVAALSSQARASAAVLVVAPVAFAVLAAFADGRVGETLLGSPVGWACLAGGALLDAAGALWMARLVGRTR